MNIMISFGSGKLFLCAMLGESSGLLDVLVEWMIICDGGEWVD